MKRMIIGAVIALGDLFAYIQTVIDFKYFMQNGVYPTPNIPRDFATEAIIEYIVFCISAVFAIYGYFAHKYK